MFFYLITRDWKGIGAIHSVSHPVWAESPGPTGRNGRRAASQRCRVVFPAFRGTNGEWPLLLFNRVPFSELGVKHSQYS